MVTTVSDLELTNADLEALCTRLKRACGAGGTVKDGVIEVQGDQREKVKRELAGLGYGVKLAGG
jgi:translation initiation factor 1